MKLISQSPVILPVLVTVEWRPSPYFILWALLFLSSLWRGNNRTTWWAPDGQPKSTHHRFVPPFFSAGDNITAFWLPSWANNHDNVLRKHATIPLWSITGVTLWFPNNSAGPGSFVLCKTPLPSPFKKQGLEQTDWSIIFYTN